MKICWIGTSYFPMAEAHDERGVPKDFVYYIAQRLDSLTFLIYRTWSRYGSFSS